MRREAFVLAGLFLLVGSVSFLGVRQLLGSPSPQDASASNDSSATARSQQDADAWLKPQAAQLDQWAVSVKPENRVELKRVYQQYVARTDSILQQYLTRFPDVPIKEWPERTGEGRRKAVPRIGILFWEPLAGRPGTLIVYSVGYSLGGAPPNMRVAKMEGGKVLLIKPDPKRINKIEEEELAIWRGGDAQARYGPPYRRSEIRLWWCNGRYPPQWVEVTKKYVRFRQAYSQANSNPAAFDILWQYDGKELIPFAYSWFFSTQKELPTLKWRRFGEKPLDELEKEVEAVCVWDGK